MEQLDEVHSDINKVESSIKVDVSSSLISESTTDIVKNEKDIPENQENKSQECTDNIIQDVLIVNKCDVTDLNKKFESKESNGTENIRNAAINEVEQEIINKDPQIDDLCKKDEKSQEEQAENTTEVGDHSRYAGDISLDKESTNNVEVFNTNEGEQNIEKHNVCTVLNIDTIGDTNAQCQALIKTLSETFDDKDQTLHVTDTDRFV